MEYKLISLSSLELEGGAQLLTPTIYLGGGLLLPMEIKEGKSCGILWNSISLIPEKLYHFEVRLKFNSEGGQHGKMFGFYIRDVRNTWYLCNVKDIDNSYYDHFTKEWVCSWRLRPILAAKTVSMGFKMSSLMDLFLFIKPEYVSPITSFIVSDVRNLLQYKEVYQLVRDEKYISSSITNVKFLLPTVNVDTVDLDLHFSLKKTVESLSLSLYDSKTSDHICYLANCTMIHRNIKQIIENMANYLVDREVDIIFWSNNGLSVDGTFCKSPLATGVSIEVDSNTIYSLSPRAQEYMLTPISGQSDKCGGHGKMLPTLEDAIKLFAERNSVYVCNPGLFYSEVPKNIWKHRNVKHGVYGGLLPNIDTSTMVSIIVLIDEVPMTVENIKNCIKSLCAQTYKNIEITIVDYSNEPTKYTSIELGEVSSKIKMPFITSYDRKNWFKDLTDIISRSNGMYTMIVHPSMISVPTRINKQLAALVNSPHLRGISCERSSSYERSSSAINGYELAIYYTSLFNGINKDTRHREVCSYSEFMYLLFSHVANLMGCKIVPERNTVVNYKYYSFYYTIPETLVN